MKKKCKNCGISINQEDPVLQKLAQKYFGGASFCSIECFNNQEAKKHHRDINSTIDVDA